MIDSDKSVNISIVKIINDELKICEIRGCLYFNCHEQTIIIFFIGLYNKPMKKMIIDLHVTINSFKLRFFNFSRNKIKLRFEYNKISNPQMFCFAFLLDATRQGETRIQ